MVENSGFSMPYMCYCPNRQFQQVFEPMFHSPKHQLECIIVKIISFRMTGLCHGQNHKFRVSPWSKWVIVATISFSMCFKPCFMFLNIRCNVPWSKSSVFAWEDCVMVKNDDFSMADMCHCISRQFQHGWIVTYYKSQFQELWRWRRRNLGQVRRSRNWKKCCQEKIFWQLWLICLDLHFSRVGALTVIF